MDQLVERRERLEGERALAREGPGCLDELESGAKIAAA